MIHLAGSFNPETGQYCVRCGLQLSAPLTNLAWEGSEPPSGWEEGSEVLNEGNYWYAVKHLLPDVDGYGSHCEVA